MTETPERCSACGSDDPMVCGLKSNEKNPNPQLHRHVDVGWGGPCCSDPFHSPDPLPIPSSDQEGERWTVREYAPVGDGRGGTRLWRVVLVGPQPTNNQSLVPASLLDAAEKDRNRAQNARDDAQDTLDRAWEAIPKP